MTSSLTYEIDSLCKKGFFNGFAVALVDEKGILYENGFGFSDVSAQTNYTTNTVQPVASVSKMLVGIALLKAQELGKLHLDDPVDAYLPFTIRQPFFPEEKITIRQLATHTSSITDNTYYLLKNYYLKPGADTGEVQQMFNDGQVFNPSDSLLTMPVFLGNLLDKNGKWNRDSFSDHKPGTFYEYSNIGTALAALVIEQATGQTFRAFTKTYILDPLQMESSGWKFEEIPFSRYSRLYENPATLLPYYEMITYPDGGFITSVSDLGRFLNELIRGYNGKGTLLSKESYSEYFTPQLTAHHFLTRPTANPYNESYNVGIFIGFGPTGYIGHTGGDPGVLSMLFFNPATGKGRIMILNTAFTNKAGNDTFYAIWNLLERYQDRLP